LIVVEINEDRSPLAAPPGNIPRPGAQGPIRVAALVAPGWPVAAHIDVTRGRLPRGGRIVMVGETKRDVMLVEETEDVVGVPALVTKLEREAVAAREHLDE